MTEETFERANQIKLEIEVLNMALSRRFLEQFIHAVPGFKESLYFDQFERGLNGVIYVQLTKRIEKLKEDFINI